MDGWTDGRTDQPQALLVRPPFLPAQGAGHCKTTYEGDVGYRPDSRLELAVEEVAERGVLLEVWLLELVEIAAERPGVHPESRLTRPDGELE